MVIADLQQIKDPKKLALCLDNCNSYTLNRTSQTVELFPDVTIIQMCCCCY